MFIAISEMMKCTLIKSNVNIYPLSYFNSSLDHTVLLLIIVIAPKPERIIYLFELVVYETLLTSKKL